DFEGEHFSLHAARCEPKPLQSRLPLWVGGTGERVTLRITAQHADGWNAAFVTPETYRSKVEALDAHCARLGRDPAEIERSVNLALAWREDALRVQFGGSADYIRPTVLIGSTQEVVDRIGEFADAGARLVNLAMRAPFDLDGLDRLAAEVLPAVR